MSLVIGLDVGTQSVKLVAYDPQARQVLASIGQPLELISGEDGSREQHASWWTEAIASCFARLEPALKARVSAIGVSGQQHGFVPLDADGNVLAPAKLWCDTSSSAQCGQIMQVLGGPAATIAAAGNPILAGYTASKLPWTREHRPEVYAQLATIALPHDYINYWLTGQLWMEHGDASGTGWLDVRTRRWSPALLQATDGTRALADCLPPLVAADALFPLSATRAAQLGLPDGVQVSAGGGDNMMAAIGTGNVVPGMLSMSLGTSGTLFAHADHPVVDAAGRWAAFCDSTGGWLPLICTMNCTVATEAVAKMFGFSSRDGDAHIAATAPGADGLLMLPFLNGERTPDLPLGKGMLAGMEPRNLSAAHVYRAAMEGATYSLKYGFDALVDAGLRFDAIRLTGGGSHSAQWRQMVADVFELPVGVPEQVEGAAFGAALQALWAVARVADPATDLAALTAEHVRLDPAATRQPNPATFVAYRAQYARFLRHLEAVGPLYA